MSPATAGTDTSVTPSSFPLNGTRSSEVTSLIVLAAPGHGVLVVGHPGDGRTDVTSAAEAALTRDPAPVLRCTPATTPDDVVNWYEAHCSSRFLRLDDVDLLPRAAAPVLAGLTQDSRACLLMTADVVAVRSSSDYAADTPLGVLSDLWRRRRLGRLDLAPLCPEETARRLSQALPTGELDVLQRATATLSARGSAAVARDLGEDLAAAPRRAPRLLPRPWNAPFELSPATSHRIASRYRDVPGHLRATAIALHQICPVEQNTASRLIGPETVTRLISTGLVNQRLVGSHMEIDIDGLQIAGLLSDPTLPDTRARHDELLASVERLWRSGHRLSDAPALALARHLVDQERAEDAAPLLAHAATVTARLALGTESEAFARRALSNGADGEVKATLWASLLLQDRHAEVLDEARRLLEDDPEEFGLAHLHRACVAASWSPSTPAWLTNHLNGRVAQQDPVLSELLRVLMGDLGLDAHRTQRFFEYGAQTERLDVARMWALAMVLSQRLHEGEPGPLEEALGMARAVRGRLLALPAPGSGTAQDSFVAFDLSCSVALWVSGLEAGHGVSELDQRIVHAVDFGPYSGRFAAACAAYLHALSDFHRGNTHAAQRDATSAMRLLSRSTFATLNATLIRHSLQLLRIGPSAELDPEVLGAHLAVGCSPHRAPAGANVAPTGGDDGSVRAPVREPVAPGWARAAQAHHRVLEGLITPDAALALLEQDDNATAPIGRLPSTLATLAHLRALAHNDPEELVKAADLLASTGKLRGARDALERARSAFLARRVTARANDCAARLSELPTSEDGPAPRPSRVQRVTARSMVPAGLTQRELEICRLVGEGLTNAQIGERLFVSVRTVESHVLQARAKLRAPRRKDIPERLARAQAHRGP